MTEVFLTSEQKALSDFFFKYDFELGWDIPNLYYYRSGSSLKTIFDKNNIILRLTRADHFPDKLEGKAVEVYYDIALESMLESGKITQEQFEELAEVEMPDRTLLIHESDLGIGAAKWEEFDAYVICFSTQKDDPFMYERYVHKKTAGGFCVEFSGVEMKSLSDKSINNESNIKLIQVMYGSQVIRYIEDQVVNVISDPFLYKNRKEVLGEVLHQVQFSAKRSRYYRENEIRMVVYLAKDDEKEHPDIFWKTDETGKKQKKYLYFQVPKYMVFNVTSNPNNDPNATVTVMNYIQTQGYSMIEGA